MLRFRSLFIPVLTALALLPAPAPALDGVARVVDGDTLVLAGERLRLFGIDAPEKGQRCDPSGRNWACGDWAAARLRALVTGGLRCEALDRDRYGRTVARCHAGDLDIGAEMVRTGAATAYRRYSTDYIAQEAEAKSALRGLWNGQTAAPETFRQAQQSAGNTRPQAQDRCAIKGNISAKGERIYHLPGQRYYDKTRIDRRKGEAMFCSEAEARAAGFRRAKR
ncbi:thermonuclease family protein [Szabonella alba]|uniref:Thermonuclease family protein n=1 Tax=Szabonella alba TaxID=2804194 RepID=A0A8K0Y0I6_9RHOB|nr:thermonuclease family protein [Szabonella alba]MBL4918240.1 thermonuclease family protein [Szabonella alba]